MIVPTRKNRVVSVVSHLERLEGLRAGKENDVIASDCNEVLLMSNPPTAMTVLTFNEDRVKFDLNLMQEKPALLYAVCRQI